MAIQEHETFTPIEQRELEEAPRPVEAITLPDGTVQPAYPLALRGLAASINNGTTLSKAAEMYKAWDPDLPETDIYRYLSA